MPSIIAHNMSDTAAGTTGRTLDYAAPLYDWLAPIMVFGFEQRCARHVIEHLDLSPSHRVLDVGCGTGSLTRRLGQSLDASAGGGIVGVDAAERMLDIARSKSPAGLPCRFVAGLAESLPYSDCTFDRAVSTFFFHHVEFNLKTKALSEMWRTLIPGSKAIVVDVDVPTTLLGSCSAWAGYRLFRQEEIRENIEGRLREAFDASPFQSWRSVSHHSGYMTLFELIR
ncbi:MAG: methyltransferase domain-containing protein [Verrucomicrobia bacterium]|jgi:ubiquinone/menaquinone biosynthesis C-methylase UbiE|nr:methyltransferase domain-containing protein [Verrucomicrobiota bacterium]